MTHDELRELAGAYAIGAVSDDEKRAVEAHLAVCPPCIAEVRSYASVVEALAQNVTSRQPPSALRSRVLADQDRRPAEPPADESLRQSAARAASPLPRWLLAAAAVACLALGLYAVRLQQQLTTITKEYAAAVARAQAADADVERWRLRASVVPRTTDVLASGDVLKIDLAGQAPAIGARARALWSRSRGLVFAAEGLPAPPARMAYQLWMVTGTGAISAGLLTANDQGHYSLVTRTDPNVPAPVALAVTLEPEGGVPSPTGPKYLVGAP